MKTAILVHETGGSPKGNWFQWLGQELMSMGYTTFPYLLTQIQHFHGFYTTAR